MFHDGRYIIMKSKYLISSAVTLRIELQFIKNMASRRVEAMTDDLKNVEFVTSEDVEVNSTFDSMGLREDLLRGIYAYGKWSLENV